MRAIHQKLHLQHHRHTGKVLRHKHTSYRGLAVVLVFTAAVMTGLSLMARVTADSLVVYARNPAPIPTTAAVITSPADGATITQATLNVSGTCPAMTPAVIVAITDNGTLAGSVPCDSSGSFSVPITVTPGQHTLIARTYTITGDNGPDSAPVTITYIPPVPPPTSITHPTAGAQTTQAGQAVAPLTLTIDEPFIVFGPAKDAIWLGTISGGKTPYHVVIKWGDGSTKSYTVSSAGQKSFAHHYRAMQPHIIVFDVSDASGQNISRDYAAVTPYVPPAASLFGGTPRSPWSGSLPLGLYGIYLVLLALFGYLWTRAHPFVYAKVPAQRRFYAARKHKRNTTSH